jgi:hypothetical protein
MALGITTLVVLFLLISRLRDEGAASRLAAAQPPADESPSPATLAKLPQPTGPTDEDEEEAGEAEEEFHALSDGTLTLGPEEMAPYNRLVSWVKSQSFMRLWVRGKKNLAYTYLYDDAQRHRGALVALDVEIRLVRDAGKNDAGIPLHEAWATTRESGNHLYDLLIVDFPKKMPVGVNIRESARFAGYFLKVQGYESGIAKPGGPPEQAPLLIGRLDWRPPAAATQSDNPVDWFCHRVGLRRRDSILLAALVVVVVLTAVAIFVFWRWRSWKTVVPRNILTPPPGGVIPVETWLEQCASGSHEGGEKEGENSQ